MTIVAPTPCQFLKWDTNFFGFRMAQVIGNTLDLDLVGNIDAWCRQARVECLYFLARADDAQTTKLAEDNGFRLVDIRVTFRNKLLDTIEKSLQQSNSDITIRHAQSEDIDSLQNIARGNYHDTRFHYDVNFPGHLSDSLYEIWIKRSCEGYADTVLVAELNHTPVGYISCHLDKDTDTGKIGLIGVGTQAQNRGIGRILVLSALEWFTAQATREVFVVTQGRNFAAQRLYQRCGFLTHTAQLWYHKWYIPVEITHD